jgi:general secretion pathway protein D
MGNNPEKANNRMVWYTRLIALTCTAALLSSCSLDGHDLFNPELHDQIDPALQLSRDDYRSMAKPNPENPETIVKAVTKAPAPPPLPDLSQILSAPPAPEIGKTQLVSISVTDDVPLKDVLLELSRLADVDIELDSGITGGISFIARDKPFNQVIKRIANLAGLRYRMTNGVLRVERDAAYIENYSLDFLNIDRASSSNVNISTNVLSAGGGENSSLNTGSTQTITATTESDFWVSLQTGIEQILNYAPVSRSSADNGQRSNNSSSTRAAATEGAGGSTGGLGSLSGGSGDNFYILNRQAGMLTVSGNDQQHKLIERFINKIRSNASAQVLIEAKIVELSLDDEYQSGVDWSKLNSKFGVVADFNSIDPTGGAFTVKLNDRIIDGFSGGSTEGASLDDFIQLVENFGTTRTLSSPRLHAINNQQAVLTFAENLVYFEISVEREEDTSSGVNQELLTIDSEVKTVPIGIILTLQPSISLENGEVTMAVRPTLSRVTGFVSDPAVAFLASQGSVNLENQIPVVEVRELDSILKLSSGETMVIGGLMENVSTNIDKGVPGVGSVPWLGNLFKSVSKDDSTRELIIFIRATIVGSNTNIPSADELIYKKFTDDPRPIAF